MTTTVCDLANKIITADTRWSCGAQGELQLSDGNYYFIYCDDTGFDKISLVGKTALITAGNGKLIAEWKKWWSGDAEPSKRPPSEVNGSNVVNLAILDLEKNEVLFHAGSKQVLYCYVSDSVKAFTSGSGAFHAASDLQLNNCAKLAVEAAAKLDHCTGPDVKFACYASEQNNLNVRINDYNVIVNGIIERGKIMALDSRKPNEQGVDIAQHPLKDELKECFTTGKAVASAPVPGISNFKWTEETDQRFVKAMNRVHELRNA